MSWIAHESCTCQAMKLLQSRRVALPLSSRRDTGRSRGGPKAAREFVSTPHRVHLQIRDLP